MIAVLIDEEVKTILDDSYKRAHTVLKTRRKELDALAEALINYETLDAEEVKAVLEGRPLKMKKKPKDGEFITREKGTTKPTPSKPLGEPLVQCKVEPIHKS